MRVLWLAGAVAGAAVLAVPASASGDRSGGGDRLGRTIKDAMHADGPLLTPEEQALIERKCGEAAAGPGGESLIMSEGVLHCRNGRKVDDPEVRAMVAVAAPRIQARVKAIMARPEIKKAIAMVASEETQRALRELRRERGK